MHVCMHMLYKLNSTLEANLFAWILVWGRIHSHRCLERGLDLTALDTMLFGNWVQLQTSKFVWQVCALKWLLIAALIRKFYILQIDIHKSNAFHTKLRFFELNFIYVRTKLNAGVPERGGVVVAGVNSSASGISSGHAFLGVADVLLGALTCQLKSFLLAERWHLVVLV